MATVPQTTPCHISGEDDHDSPSQPFDGILLLLAGVLMTLGVVMVYSASVTVRGAELDYRQWWDTPLRQCVFALAGFFGMLLAAHCGYRWLTWEKPHEVWRVGLLYLLALMVLVLVQFVGREVLGARRALVVLHSPFTLSFQPAELAKIVMVIWLAALLTRMQVRSAQHPAGAALGIRNLGSGFLPAMLSAGLLIALTGLEDFGTAALMAVLAGGMLILGGACWRHLLGAGLVGLVGGVGLVLLKPYRLQRIIDWWMGNPDPRAGGYQIDQSMLAIGSGGWFGRGLGAGVQKYGYLPQKDNDFILATICEELGVVGGIVVVVLFLLFLWRGFQVARNAADPFGRLLASGLTLLICLQAAFNVAVVTNSVPTKGISLPFVSSGGSGVVFLGLSAGLLASIGYGQRLRPPKVTPAQPTVRHTPAGGSQGKARDR
ncbi:MAG: FtsW/RodA/SpoVE family cell cycle protein [Planctomycetota bacterium]